ncbi:MAG: FAD-binding oxidoreductase [Myxococcota bacterium]
MSQTRSHWGWGFEASLPSETERAELAAQLRAVFSWTLPAPRPYPTLDQATVPTPRIAIPGVLAPFCTADRDERARHTYGRAFPDLLRGYRGDFSPAPDMVAIPRDEDDILSTLKWASGANVAVVPFGGGSSVTGGVECRGDGYNGVISLDLRNLNKVLEIDRTALQARIQGGALGPDLEAALGNAGLSLRHFPQSFMHSTLGGWIATRSGGHFATRYTHIDELVSSIRMLTPVGPWESRRLPGSGAGPSPDRLVMGSEGILGVITEAWMRVFPRPIFRSKATVHFSDYARAVAATRAIAQARLYPSNCRLLDQNEAMLNLVAFGAHVLLLGFESADASPASLLDRAVQIAQDHGGTLADGPTHTEDHADRSGNAQNWRAAFLRAPYRQSALLTLDVIADTFETAITWERFPALHEAVLQATRSAGAKFVSCRFTHVYPDGPAPYYTFLLPAPHDEMMARWRAVKTAASDVLIEHGATITHHHAVGRTHRPWYDQQRPDTFAHALHATKRALDPAQILNPGVLIDPKP